MHLLKLNIISLAVILLALFAGNCAIAQTMPQTPSGTYYEENRNKLPPENLAAPSFNLNRENTNNRENVSSKKFYINGYEFSGNTIINNAQLYQLSKKYSEREVTLGEVFTLADEITTLYSKNGFAFAFALIPVQDVRNGIIKIRIIEGHIEKLEFRIKESPLISKKRVQRFLENCFSKVLASPVVKSKDIEMAALLARDYLGQDVGIIIAPSKTTPNAAILTIEVKLKRLEASVNADNFIRLDFGENRYGANFTARSLIRVGDKLGYNYKQGEESKYFSYTGMYYVTPIFRNNLSLSLEHSDAQTRAKNGLLGVLNFKGNESVNSIGIKWSRSRSRSFSNFLSASLVSTTSISGILGTKLIIDEIRTLDFGSNWYWWFSDGSQIDASLVLSAGLNGLGASKETSTKKSRTIGTPDFTSIKGNIDWNKAFLNNRLLVSAGSEFQLGNGKGSFAARECSYGGEAYGTPYNAGAIGGENCLKAKIRFDLPFQHKKLVISPFFKADYAIVKQAGSLDFAERRISEAGSFGVGVSVGFQDNLYGELSVTKPTNYSVSPDGTKAAVTKFTIGIRK